MSLPQPDVALNDVCSVVFNNTLYTYSADAFQSLSLEHGATWNTLPSGVAVSGAACVGSTPGNAADAGFYVVGGNSSSSDYYGLQKFTYATGKWATLNPETHVTQQRLYHGAVYLSASDSILLYAGSQDGSSGQSTQTFTVGASAPYTVISYQSSAPPTTNPMLLQWSDSAAVLLGGSTTNTDVMLFSPTTGWTNSGASLAEPFTKDTSNVQAALVTGDDGSKSVYAFDMSVSPNSVSRIVLLDASGNAVTNSPVLKRSQADEDAEAWADALRLRDTTSSLTLANWPAYNSTLAPTTTRTGFSVSEGDDGQVVIVGGGGKEVLCVFEARSNTWANATSMLADTEKFSIQSTPHTSSAAPSLSITSTASASASPVASTTAAVAAAVASSSASSPPVGTILGAVLGSVAGLIFILVAVYFLLMQRRKQRNLKAAAAHHRSQSPGASSEKDAFEIVNGNFPRPIGGGKATFRGGHQAQDSQGSFSSVAILMGRVNQHLPQDGSNGKDSKGSSALSTYQNKGLKGTISKPIPQATPVMTENALGASAIPRQAQFDRTSQMSSYGRSVTQAVTQARPPREDEARPADDTRRSSGWNRYWSGGSALNFLGVGGNSGNQGANVRGTMASEASSRYSTAHPNPHRITQDSATVPPLDVPMVVPMIPEAQPRFHRVNSGSPTVASFNHYVKEAVQGTIERSNSQLSSQSGYSSGIPASVQDSWDPTAHSSERPWGADRAPSSAYTGSQTTVFTTPLAPAAGGPKTGVSGQPSGLSRQHMASTSSDMSWLNLGGASRV